MLKNLGLDNVTEAKDGEIAKDILKENADFNIVISDWNMPNMDGLELVKWIRKEYANKAVPFIMASGRGEKSEIAKAREGGASGFVTKPFNPEELKEILLRALGLEEEKVVESRVPEVSDSGKIKLKIAHIQITDHLVLGMLKYLINQGELNPKYFELETVCMPSWNPLAKALETGTVDGACILAPIAMDLYGFGVPIKLVLFAHKNGSIFVRNKKGGDYREPYPEFFRQKSFYIPHMLSIHNVLGHMFFNGMGLKYGVSGEGFVDVNFEIVPPIKMPEMLAENPDTCGYLVAEPLGTKSIAAGNAELQFLSSEIWEDHPCCVVTMQDLVIDKYQAAVQEFTAMLVKAGKTIASKPDLAAEVAVNFLDPDKKLGLKVPLLKNVLTEPKGITTDDLYPDLEDLDRIQKYMHHKMGIGQIIDVNEFVDLRFAKNAVPDYKPRTKRTDVENEVQENINKIVYGAVQDKDQRSKALLNDEGQYLIFDVDNRKFGINILSIKEIIRMKEVEGLPQMVEYVRGVILYRGTTIPVVDLRRLLGLGETEYHERTVMIVVEFEEKKQTRLIAFIVDNVREVRDIFADDIEKPKHAGGNKVPEYIVGLTKDDDEIRTLINLDTLLQIRGDGQSTMLNYEELTHALSA